ncbi:hypothetical protein ACFU9F_02800 [Streptomyces zhihengii]|uniref:hypothetical protein n=1 Tax=Streptomyces zhihengii TaxID=1818004 RepID=UPI0036CE5644
MDIALLRILLAPSLVLVVSLVARRAGPALGGRLLGAPTTTGPFLLLMCCDSGGTAAAEAAEGGVTGQLAVVCFCLAYAWIATRLRPAGAFGAALVAAGAGACAGALSPSVWATAGLSAVLAAAGLPRGSAPAAPAGAGRAPRWWDLPARMALAATTVLTAVAAAGALGSRAGGVLSSLPVLLAIMVPAAHRAAGPAAAAAMSRGAARSAVGTLAFVLVLSVTAARLGVLAFAVALVALALTGPAARAAVRPVRRLRAVVPRLPRPRPRPRGLVRPVRRVRVVTERGRAARVPLPRGGGVPGPVPFPGTAPGDGTGPAPGEGPVPSPDQPVTRTCPVAAAGPPVPSAGAAVSFQT